MKTVFINCPYDDEFSPILRLIIFMCCYFGFEPKLACCEPSENQRLENIINLIKSTDISIHDISRIESSGGKYPRFNMPFELGMDYFFFRETNNKKMLIMDREEGTYFRTLSDLQGLDIKPHYCNSSEVTRIIRDFFIKSFSFSGIKAASYIFKQYSLFNGQLMNDIKNDEFEDINEITTVEYIVYVKKYLMSNNLNVNS